MNFDCIISTQTCQKSAIHDMAKMYVYIFKSSGKKKRTFMKIV